MVSDAVSASFNPCYVGLWSVSTHYAAAGRSKSGFNPCYVGLWSVSRVGNSGTAPSDCFNPCYVGLWSVSCDHADQGDGQFEFQSLLCWIMVCKSSSPVSSVSTSAVSILVMLDYGL